MDNYGLYVGFVIDTNTYAGNFEREMAAYITGVDTGRGEQYIRPVEDRVRGLVYLVDSEDTCRNICSSYPTPGWFNHGQGGHFRDGQEEEALQHYKQTAVKYYTGVRDCYQERMDRGEVQFQETVNDYQNKSDEAEALTEVHKYRAYLSVIIYFANHQVLTEDVIEFMKSRAYEYAEMKNIEIEGFRKVWYVETSEIV